MELQINNKSELEKVLGIASGEIESLLLKKNKGVKIVISEIKEKRTSNQNAFYWVIYEDLTRFYRESENLIEIQNKKVRASKNVIHEINKSFLPIKESTKRQHTSTTTLNVQEFCDYMEETVSIWRELTNFSWLPPESNASYFEKNGYEIDENGRVIIKEY